MKPTQDFSNRERFSEFSAWDDLVFTVLGLLALTGPFAVIGLFAWALWGWFK
jgi:hypothetical protein